MSKLANVSSVHLLPDEIWILILLKIPIKSILICTAVCKSLNSLIKSPSFISSHLDHSISESNSSNGTHLCFFRYVTKVTFEHRYCLCLDDDELTEYTRLSVPPIRFRSQAGISGIFGSCNGLILFGQSSVEVRNKLFLWNPVVRKLLMLPLPDFRIHRVGLAFDSITNDYQVLVLNLYGSIKIARYSLKSNSWNRFKDVESPRYTTLFYACDSLIFLNGNFHFVGHESYKSKMILSFGMRDGVYREIRLPNALPDPSFVTYDVHVCTGLLSVSVLSMDDQVFDIWVMKEYGVEDTWTLLAKFTPTHLPYPKVWSFRKNGDVLLEVDGQLMLFNPRSNMTKCIEIAFGGFFDGSFVESLVLLNEGDSWSDDGGGLLDFSSDWNE